MLKIASIICFSLLLSGCITTGTDDGWEKPIGPKLNKIKFEEQSNGFFISAKDALTLADNIDEMEAYIEKLEVFIDEMVKYYK